MGFGPGTNGELQLFESELEAFAAITHISIAGGSYNTQNGETYPDCGDFDGDGRDEIVVGRGVGGSGQLELFEDELSGLAPAGSLVVSWLTYNIASGVTRPAAGDIDGDGRDEILVGLLKAGEGWVRHFDPTQLGDGTVDLPGIAGWLQEKSWALAISGAALAR